MNILKLILEAVLKKGGGTLIVWLSLSSATMIAYRAYGVALDKRELAGMAAVYGILILAVARLVAWRRATRSAGTATQPEASTGDHDTSPK